MFTSLLDTILEFVPLKVEDLLLAGRLIQAAFSPFLQPQSLYLDCI